ncbi:hypothetical protein HR060_14750 [Catenovulum sp. SM1970]|uniref:hypothetical protein n=1 Tax=Marinifaba aquimaris TaxID=2741323 RepID=UPI001573406B|nr:hypothetical protein [Marinifaba aquimaris]NTS78114.1 hypothetical protein [Marinifaba aquimaris]
MTQDAPNTEELQTLMAASKQDAISFATEQFDIELDGSMDSVTSVDDVLLQCAALLKSQQEQDKFIFTVCNIFGAYVGEVFKETIGGTWVYDTTNPEAPTVMLSYADKTYAFAGMCYQRLVNDANQSVRKYLELAIANHVQ